MLPPYAHYGPTGLPVQQWFEEWYPKFADSAYECVQEAGEILFVPQNYMHTVLNLQPSVGAAVEVGHAVHLLDALLAEVR